MPRLGRSVLASLAYAATIIATSLVSIPVALDAVGPAGFGVWTLAMAVVVYAGVLQMGLSPAIQREAARSRGRGDAAAIGRLAWTALVASLALGVAGGAVALAVAQPVVALASPPAGLRADALATFRWVALALVFVIASAGTGSLLMGVGRFGALALTAGLSSVAFCVSVVLLAPRHGISGLGAALAIQYGGLLVLRLIALRRELRPPAQLVPAAELRALVRFSARLQVYSLAELINWQSGRLVVAAVAPADVLGRFGVGAQMSDAARLVGGAAINPVVSELARAAGEGGEAEARRRFARLHRRWILALAGLVGIGMAALPGLVDAWLGPGYDQAAGFGALLLLGSGFGLATGTGVAYLRAIGRPGMEARYGLVVLAANVALTVPAALALGATGVAAATAVAYLVGAAWLYRHLIAEGVWAPSLRLRTLARPAAALLAGAAIAAAGTRAAADLLPDGASFAAAALAAAAGLGAYAAVLRDSLR